MLFCIFNEVESCGAGLESRAEEVIKVTVVHPYAEVGDLFSVEFHHNSLIYLRNIISNAVAGDLIAEVELVCVVILLGICLVGKHILVNGSDIASLTEFSGVVEHHLYLRIGSVVGNYLAANEAVEHAVACPDAGEIVIGGVLNIVIDDQLAVLCAYRLCPDIYLLRSGP